MGKSSILSLEVVASWMSSLFQAGHVTFYQRWGGSVLKNRLDRTITWKLLKSHLKKARGPPGV